MDKNPRREKEIYDLWLQGWKIRAISERTGIPKSSVGYYVKKFKDMKKRGLPTGPSVIDIIDEPKPTVNPQSDNSKLGGPKKGSTLNEIVGPERSEASTEPASILDKYAGPVIPETELNRILGPGSSKARASTKETAVSQIAPQEEYQMSPLDKIVFKESYEKMRVQYGEFISKKEYEKAIDLCNAILSFIKLDTALTPMINGKRRIVSRQGYVALMAALDGRMPPSKAA